MNSHYFDVEAWERQKAEESAKRRREEEEGGSSKKKISKKDMVRCSGWRCSLLFADKLSRIDSERRQQKGKLEARPGSENERTNVD